MSFGTGVVKITPAHDNDDFEVGLRHNLPRIQVIGFDGKMLPICGEEIAGLTVEEARKKTVKNARCGGITRGREENATFCGALL